MKSAAVFLDRDGVLNEEVGHLSRPGELRLLPGAARAVRRLNTFGVPALVVTNQSVVARGLCTESDVDEVHRVLQRMLAVAAGAHLDGVYYCPHHPDGHGPYRVACRCRKPRPGLLQRAARDHRLDLRRSVMIGDQVTDMEAGWQAGCRTVLVLTGYGREARRRLQAAGRQPDYTAAGLEDAVGWCLRHSNASDGIGGEDTVMNDGLQGDKADSLIRKSLRDSIAVQEKLLEAFVPNIARIAELLIETFHCGGCLFLLGNGGSAAEAQHVAAEFVGRFRHTRRPLPAIALTTDTSILTAVGNDVDFAQVFARQVEALVRPGDVVAALSTSGASPNVIEAVRAAHRRGATTIGFTGNRQGPLARHVNIAVEVPLDDTARIQEAHLVIWHIICELVESAWK